ncbi:MAG TPA: hypothetical protein IGS53_00720 [Leptolyngbyaceae cyanobacterium M33_DOE_097]|uniref:Uncharacterized protein n=1 Tax=Oscillatoriales cyanobacterium SpSt-418 TaxID=2282169 RepID=A0A7C3KF23_9CYAN|nr:hypothetical protein [Leptolyngbyaceae cyanobacterium M33_DOE_097]
MPLSSEQPASRSEALTVLQTVYGQPSQAGFGSAVFQEMLEPGSDLESVALRYYQHFVGPQWEQFGEAAWMSTWKRVYVRPDGIQPDIVTELQAIANPLAVHYVPLLLLADTDDHAKAQQALAAVFDDSQTTNLSLYAIGDGAAMSGLLLIGCQTTGETTILISLLD